MHLESVLFALMAALLRSASASCNETCGAVEPARQHNVLRESACLSHQQNKNSLGDFLCQQGIAHLARSRRVNKIQVPIDQFRECLFGMLCYIFSDQFRIIHSSFVHSIIPAADLKADKKV